MRDQIVLPTHHRFKNLTGCVFGRWTVTAYAGKRCGMLQWQCRCECGTEKLALGKNLKSGKSQSCGCLRSEITGERAATHRRKGTTEHNSWSNMKDRCYNENCSAYQYYGARGISVCARWRNSFENFLEDMGEKPSSEHSLEREDNDGNYCRENCVWATRKEQQRNTRANRMLTYDGKTQCLVEWAEELSMDSKTLWDRLNRLEWPVERALFTPVLKIKKRN